VVGWLSSDGVWGPIPLVNAVKEAVERLSKNGELPVTESDVIAYIENMRIGIRPSRADVVNALIVLETLGYVRVVSSGRTERIIYYRGGGEEEGANHSYPFSANES
jgi:hypothetical protein